MRNLHVPLPDDIYQRLRLEAERRKTPATSLAREAIDHWLAEQHRRAVRDAISAYAAACAGGPADLDEVLGRAAVEHLRRVEDE